jgi:hypothetical protein
VITKSPLTIEDTTMRLPVRVCCLLGVIAAWNAMGASAQAQYNGMSNGLYLYNLPYNLYGMETVPYYSLHPPVYYSFPVPRTYGYSPFAYPPGYVTPDLAPQPLLMTNPHAKPTGRSTSPTPSAPRRSVDRVTVAPRVIVNPYAARAVRSSERVAAIEPGSKNLETDVAP